MACCVWDVSCTFEFVVQVFQDDAEELDDREDKGAECQRTRVIPGDECIHIQYLNNNILKKLNSYSDFH